MNFLLASQTYLEALIIIYAEMLIGKIPSQGLIDQARKYGQFAKVPEVELNILETIGHDGATIH